MNRNDLKDYFLFTLDPVHIGTGGYRLGRVDNTIVREPGTNLPKIPGTSLSGVARTYATYCYDDTTCAGQKGHCGNCPICYTFGKGETFAGAISVFDAQIMLFPVYSMVGPIWVTTPLLLAEMGSNHEIRELKNECFVPSWEYNKPLNVGWLLLKNNDSKPKSIKENLPPILSKDPFLRLKNQIVVVTDFIFPQIVNSNLEIRTSVAIKPETGAAQPGALFTYEAIPRGTVLKMEVGIHDYQKGFNQFLNPSFNNQAKVKNLNWSVTEDVFVSGMRLAEMLGVGGMGTRGFGRIKLIDP